MKAFLLAAGLGTRLGELTRRTPKCLLPVGGRPLLDYWFDALEAAGVEEALVNLHHHAEVMRAYLDSKATTVRIRTLDEPTLLGSAGTIRAAWDFVTDGREFFIIYADNFARVDLSRLARFHREHGNPLLTLVAYRTDEPQRCGIVELDKQQRVVSFEEKPRHPRTHFANAGLHVAGPGLYDYLPARVPADLGFDVLPKLIGKMAGYVTDEYIQDIGTPELYARAQRAAIADS
jgi:NDP-sugar pyrophosphorylase family protein